MQKKLSFILLLISILGLAKMSFGQTEKPVILFKGFDAVALTQGKEVKGKEKISIVRGRFKYLFANEKNKKTFENNPEIYEVQNNGECTFMPGVPGDPELWQVYQDKIYLFGTSLCRERFNLSPETILHPEKREKIKVRNVAIVLFERVELLDFAGPGEVFAAAQTVDGQNAFNVYTVAASTEPITSQGFVKVTPQYSFADAPKPDIIVFPGGNVNNLIKDKTAMTWAKAASGEEEIAMSVCTGAFILAESELLANRNITTHWASITKLKRTVPNANVVENVRFVDSGEIVTTAGVSAGIDGALHIVERLLGKPAAKLTARYMEYNWQPKNSEERK